MDLLFYYMAGLGDSEQSNNLQLADGSYNFYPDGEGYLTNYPGRTDYYYRKTNPIGGGPEIPGSPALSDITRILAFRDVRGYEHIVFVQGANLCRVSGNGYDVLHTFSGRTIGGKYYPDLFQHEAKLIIVNFGDPVLMWDGFEGVHPLGVQEIPMPPEARTGKVPGIEDNYDPAATVGTFYSNVGYGPFKYKCWWWTGQVPENGAGDNLGADGTTQVDGVYEVCVQFFDKYGNHGPVSSPSRAVDIIPNKAHSNVGTGYNDTASFLACRYLTVDYYPPQIEKHIYGVKVGRTLSLNADGGAGYRGIYWEEKIVEDTTTCRTVLQLTDGQLANQNPIDSLVRGPTQSTMGCSWGNRIFLSGHEDPYRVTWSDVALFGQFRPNNEYKAVDHVKRVMPLGDRVVIITRSTTEVIYDNSGSMATLEQDYANGSSFGRSFIDAGGAIFGLWNRGFGYYDGKEHTYVEAPYYIKDIYLDQKFYINSAVKWNDFYVLSCRKDIITAGNNFLIVYELSTRRWFLIRESVYDIALWKGGLLGVDDSIYELFRGAFTRDCVIHSKGLIPNGDSPMLSRNLKEIRLLMEPSSISPFTVEVEGEFTGENTTSRNSPHSLPSKQAAGRKDFPVPYWDGVTRYAEGVSYTAPRDVWITPPLGTGVAGYTHAIKFTFPAGHRVRIKALGLTFSNPGRAVVT